MASDEVKARHLDKMRAVLQATMLAETWKAYQKLDATHEKWGKRPFHELWRDREVFKEEYARLEASDAALKALTPKLCEFEIDCTSVSYVRAATRTMRNAAATALAILIYQRDNKKLPEKLDQVTRRFPGLDATDLFSGQPLIYRRANDGASFT